MITKKNYQNQFIDPKQSFTSLVNFNLKFSQFKKNIYMLKSRKMARKNKKKISRYFSIFVCSLCFFTHKYKSFDK